jgi:serine protease Do
VQDVSEEIAESMKVEKLKGAFVTDLVKDGPADKAGILPTDIITKIDDQEISEMKILPKTVAKYAVGKVIKVTILRRGKAKIINVKVAKMKDEESGKIDFKPMERKQSSKSSEQILGIGLVDLNGNVRKTNNIESGVQGVLITEVGLKSEAATKGLLPGDIILSINQTPVSSIVELKEIFAVASKSDKKLYLFFKRGKSNYGAALSPK